MLAAVLTGDIVGSQSLSDQNYQRCISVLEQTIEICQERFGAVGEVYRGDSFQLYTEKPEDSLLMALVFRLALLSSVDTTEQLDARISIGVASTERLSSKVVNSKGEAFVLSGRAIEQMAQQRLAFSSSSEPLNRLFSVLLQYIDRDLGHLRYKAAKAFLLRLSFPDDTQEQLAIRMGIGRTSYSRFLSRYHYRDLENVLAVYRAEIGNPIYWN